MKKKKFTTFAVASILSLSLMTPATSAAFLPGVSSQKGINDFELKVKQLDEKGIPSFLSGKLSNQKIKTEADVKKFLKDYSSVYQVNTESLKLLDKETDDLGMTHYTFQQTIGNYPIEGAVFSVHTDKTGSVTVTNGNLYGLKDLAKLKKQYVHVNGDSAIDLAWKHIDLKPEDTELTETIESLHGHDHSLGEEQIKQDTVYIYHEDQFILAQKVQLQFIEPYGANWQIYVNAVDGSIIKSKNAIMDAETTGTGTGVNGASRTLNTYYANGTYYLFDVTKPMNGVIETRTANYRTSLPGSYSVDSNNNWSASSQRAEVDAHYFAGQVYDYYLNKHGRNSYDGNGATIRSTVHYSSNYNNAFWNGSQMVYGDGDGSTFKALSGSLDVVAHEITHAVTERTAGLVYENQPGALNESFSDVFGYFLDTGDYLIGEDVYTPGIAGDALRSMSNPNAYGQPDHMDEYQNLPNTQAGDWGGVHINSGIPNKAAYYTIQSIGAAKAEKIYYRALTNYLTPYSNFSNARAAMLQATADLYGSGSSTYSSVQSAWNSVGVY
ncbi:peptidase M4 [Bacillus coahuilensis m2-6]|uniref:Neutral metalloproteinase n=1 Tax=Bacillus coahuilensis p1.1.43 TaxID=1150625 RepID=A0A147K5L8_9BACI|nr:M4 family metallopeptidase [Bacillus coahuilensis]KUP04500.1 peptidase M4 [Bacillus coahuilensis m2-6]KUP04912.1 peptidase M4 [Bacillus coahuilensis p1.1.43]